VQACFDEGQAKKPSMPTLRKSILYLISALVISNEKEEKIAIFNFYGKFYLSAADFTIVKHCLPHRVHAVTKKVSKAYKVTVTFSFFIFVYRKPNYENLLEQISKEQNFRVIYVCSEVGPHSVQCLDRDLEIRIRQGRVSTVQFLDQDPLDLFPCVRTYR
jgi:hypothetical protein